MDLKLDVILRTHSTSNVHPWGERYVGAPKQEVMLRSVNSIVTSLNVADADIRLTVVDDASTPDALKELRKILARSKYPVEFISCEAKIQNDSTLAHFKAGRDRGREAVYFVEDDYLHAPSALPEMLEAYVSFKTNLGGREVALHPYDDPNNYPPREYGNEPCRAVLGTRRHWRTNTHTTNTCWLSKKMLLKHWDAFEHLARNYGIDPTVGEQNTLNRIWREDTVLFTPLPSLALHLQYEQHKDPYINWKEWWDAAAY